MNKELVIGLASAEECTGCAACASVCPVEAIRMKKDALGFLIPEVNNAHCIRCQKCRENCPVCSPLQRKPQQQSCYAAQAEDRVRLISTSGGIFSLLAESVLASNGVVFGVEIDRTLDVHHVAIDTAEQLYRLRGAKYVQSNPRNTYLEAKNFLEAGRTVLYSGCPCQIAALYKVLGKEYSNLYTVDLLCLGVPSQDFFISSLNGFTAGTIQEVSFRDKLHGQGWKCDSLFIRTTDGGEYHYDINNSAFEACFHKKIFLRESCYKCGYNNLQRMGDITLGDFWQIEEYDPSLNDNKGTSLVLVNSSRGRELFESIQRRMLRTETVPPEVSYANRIHGNLIKRPLSRSRFLELYFKYGYEKAAEYAGFEKYDVGIVGCWSVENHGSNMTYYALYQTIRDMGLEPLMIERPRDSLWKPNEQPTGFTQSPYRAWDLAPIFANRQEMRTLNDHCDTFLLGSDQLLYHDLYNSFGEFADLGYIRSSKRKIAYATSVGRSSFSGTQEQRAKLSYFLRRFQAISVREQDAIPLFQDVFDVKAQLVLDPVFLCEKKYYQEMAKRGRIASDQPYIAVYMLDLSPEKERVISEISRELGMPYRFFSDVARSMNHIQDDGFAAHDVTPTNEDWLRALIDSEYIITDSFHGTCFAIIFQKKFLSIANPYRGKSRFESLLHLLNLENRMVENIASSDVLSIIHDTINYSQIELLLDEEKKKSLQWLQKALHCQCDVADSGYDLLSEEMRPVREKAIEAQTRSLTNEQWLANTHQQVVNVEMQLSSIYQRLDAIEPWLANTHQQVVNVETQLSSIYQRLDAIEPWLANTHQQVINVEAQLLDIHQRLEGFERQLESQNLWKIFRNTIKAFFKKPDNKKQ